MLRENIGGARIEIHHFSDASEEAYGCAAYVRVECPNGEIDVNLLQESKGAGSAFAFAGVTASSASFITPFWISCCALVNGDRG